MADKSYGIQNLSYRDRTRTEDYNLVRVKGKSTYEFPVNGPECTYAFPSIFTEMTCTESTQLLDTDRYTQQEFDNLVEDLKYDTLEKIDNTVVEVDLREKAEADLVGTIDLFGTKIMINKVVNEEE